MCLTMMLDKKNVVVLVGIDWSWFFVLPFAGQLTGWRDYDKAFGTPTLWWQDEKHGVTFPGWIAVVCQRGAEVSSTRRRSPWVSLRQFLRVGAWNVSSQREDDHLSLLSSELKRFSIGIAALSEVQRPDSGEIMADGYTYYSSGHSDGYHAQGVVVARVGTHVKHLGSPI